MIHKHIDGVLIEAMFSKEKPRPLYRYFLDIKLKSTVSNNKTACVILQNPSYADEEKADKTIQFMEKVVFQTGKAEKLYPEFNGVSRLIIVNLFAFRQTHDFEGKEIHIGPDNDRAIKDALKQSDIIIIGWGKSKRFKSRQDVVKKWVEQIKKKPIYETASHPSRARYIGFIRPFAA